MRPLSLGKYKMTTTDFYSPKTITQVDVFNDIINRPSIPWTHTANVISKDAYASSVSPLTTVSGFWQEKFYRETSQLWLTNFSISNFDNVVGIEFELNAQRNARVQDLLIQLVLDNAIIGENRASIINPVQSDMNTAELTPIQTPINDYNIYGAPDDMWGTSLTGADIANSTFGIVISFKSNQIIPHSDIAYVDQVGIRITYA